MDSTSICQRIDIEFRGVDGLESVFRRLEDGSSGEGGAREVEEVLAARCMNFIVNSREDIILGALPGVFADAMVGGRES